jgi:outer membrane protein OmpA-like peptidoglycan-associated protein
MKNKLVILFAVCLSTPLLSQTSDSIVKKNQQAIEALKNRINELDAKTALGVDAFEELAKQKKIIAAQADTIETLKKELLSLHENKLMSKYSGNKKGVSKDKEHYEDFRNNPYILSKLGPCNCVRVYFETNETAANFEMYRELDSIANVYKSNPTLKIRLDGHADKTGSDSQNQTLSQNRAMALKKYLVETKKIKEDNILVQWHGSKMPSLDAANEEEQFLNRRVEVFVVKD